MKSLTLKTEKYLIRPFKKDDSLFWQKWDTDPEIQAHMPEPKNEASDISEQYKYIEECESDEDGYYWSIETNEGVTIGTVSLFEINQYHGSSEISIVIGDKSYWGKGVSTEVLKEIIRYSFEELNLQYLSAEVEYDNTPMKKVFDKLGFNQDGLFKQSRIKDGKRIDVIHFGLSK